MTTKFNFSTFNPKKPYAFDPPYTMAHIVARIEEAVDTVKRLPHVKTPKVVCYWPQIVRDYWEAYGQEPEPLRMGPPTSKAISEADEVMEWLRPRILNPYESRLVWLRCAGWKWKKLKQVFKKSEDTLQNDFKASIWTIYQRLAVRKFNGEHTKHGIVGVRRF